MNLAATTERLRKRLIEYRYTNRFDTKIHAEINTIEMALNFAELAIDKRRPVAVEEEHWFTETWSAIHTLDKPEWTDIIDLYRNLGFKLRERNWFR